MNSTGAGMFVGIFARMTNFKLIQHKADLLRKWSMISTSEAGSGHPTSCLSAADLTAVLFDSYFRYDLAAPLNLYNDRFVLSKGHASPLLYALFGLSGAFPLEELKTLRKFGSRFEGHPVPKFEHSEAATGSLGQGLSVGAGLALVSKRENLGNKIFVLLGDGELAEGQVWEAANFASYHKLGNLIAILDINRLAQSGETMFGHDMLEYENRFKAFGFEVISIDGHDLKAIDAAFEKAIKSEDKPVAIIANTLKGKGISFLEDKAGWHGKILNADQLKEALDELGELDDKLRFELISPDKTSTTDNPQVLSPSKLSFDSKKKYATREVFGEVFSDQGKSNKKIYGLDADVKNSTFTTEFMDAHPERFVECFVAEQNMVTVAVGLARLGKIPVVATFAAFLTRAADQIRMARVSEANIKFVGSHVGVSIGEDGPSQMGLEDIALFGSQPDVVILQPCDAVSTARLIPIMLAHMGMTYLRTLRPKTPVIYAENDLFEIGGSKVLKQSSKDKLTVAATGITVFEALKAWEILHEMGIPIRIVDCYSINPIDAETLKTNLQETELPILITVEDHYSHGGMGDFAHAALGKVDHTFIKMAVHKISRSGEMDQLLDDAGINAANIVQQVKQCLA